MQRNSIKRLHVKGCFHQSILFFGFLLCLSFKSPFLRLWAPPHLTLPFIGGCVFLVCFSFVLDLFLLLLLCFCWFCCWSVFGVVIFWFCLFFGGGGRGMFSCLFWLFGLVCLLAFYCFVFCWFAFVLLFMFVRVVWLCSCFVCFWFVLCLFMSLCVSFFLFLMNIIVFLQF